MELLKTLTLHLELFAGTDISDAARDLCQLAGRVGVLCEVDFNGVKLWARPGDNPQHLVQAYHEQLQRAPAHYKIAQARDARPAAAVQEMQTDARKMCTCDGAGRGPGRACVVQAGGRLGDLWKCAKSAASAVPSDAALNTLAKLFHNGEEIEGDDGAAMMVDMALWHEAAEAFDSLIGEGDGEALASSAAPAVPRHVRKIGGSFQHTGTVVAEFRTLAGESRIVLEFDAPVAGMLHVYRPDQVESITGRANG